MSRTLEINTSANPAFVTVNDDTTGGGPVVYANFAAFPAAPAGGVGTTQQFAIAADTGILYCSNGGSWHEMLVLG